MGEIDSDALSRLDREPGERRGIDVSERRSAGDDVLPEGSLEFIRVGGRWRGAIISHSLFLSYRWLFVAVEL